MGVQHCQPFSVVFWQALLNFPREQKSRSPWPCSLPDVRKRLRHGSYNVVLSDVAEASFLLSLGVCIVFFSFSFFFLYRQHNISTIAPLVLSRKCSSFDVFSFFFTLLASSKSDPISSGNCDSSKKKKGKGNERECGMEEKKNPMRRSPLQALTDRKDAEGLLFLVYLCCRTVFLCALLRLFFFFSPSSFLFRFPWQLVFCFLLRVRARAFVFSGVKCG